jgi:hypothetical protein
MRIHAAMRKSSEGLHEHNDYICSTASFALGIPHLILSEAVDLQSWVTIDRMSHHVPSHRGIVLMDSCKGKSIPQYFPLGVHGNNDVNLLLLVCNIFPQTEAPPIPFQACPLPRKYDAWLFHTKTAVV